MRSDGTRGADLVPAATPSRRGGPATVDGKRRSAQNAIRHGLTARQLLLDDEDASEFEEHRRGFEDALSPIGALEEWIVEQIVATSWRMRRIALVEAEQFERNRPTRAALGPPVVRTGLSTAFGTGVEQGFWPVLQRYESHLLRAVGRHLHELERLQRARRGEQTPAPAVLDIDVTSHEEGCTSAPVLIVNE